jgi:hypothetical protein
MQNGNLIRKVMDSLSDEVIGFSHHLILPAAKKISTRNLAGGKREVVA